MIKRLAFILSLPLAVLVTTPLKAVEFMHCYLGEGPAEAPFSSSLDVNVAGLFTALQTASLKHACGLDTADDRAMLQRILDRGQCSAASEVAGFVANTFTMSSEEMREGIMSDPKATPELLEKLCAAAADAACTPGDEAYDAACEDAIDTLIAG